MKRALSEPAPAPLLDLAEIDRIREEAARAPHGERAKARQKQRDRVHAMLRAEVGMPSATWWRNA